MITLKTRNLPLKEFLIKHPQGQTMNNYEIVEFIKELLPKYYGGLTWNDVDIRSRKAEYVEVRRAFTYYVYNYTTLTLQRIGDLFTKYEPYNPLFKGRSGKDHSTILFLVRKYNDFIKVEKPSLDRHSQFESELIGKGLKRVTRLNYNNYRSPMNF